MFLYNLDDLARIAERNRMAREAEIARCRAILTHRADGLWSHVQQYLSSASDPSCGPAARNAGEAGQAAAP